MYICIYYIYYMCVCVCADALLHCDYVYENEDCIESCLVVRSKVWPSFEKDQGNTVQDSNSL